MNRAQRRQAERKHMRRQRRPQQPLISDHGRAVIVYDEVTDVAKAIDLERFPYDEQLLDHVFPGISGSELSMLPGVSPSIDILGWAKYSIAEIRALGPVDGSRVMVSAWCEHIRDEAAAMFPFAGDPLLRAAFDEHPTDWLVVAIMPRARSAA